MNVIQAGKKVGEIVMVGKGRCSSKESGHGYLLYGFMRNGCREATHVMCDAHLHTAEGYFMGIINKLERGRKW